MELKKEQMEEVLGGILSRSRQELLATPQSELDKYWYFKYDPTKSKEWNLYKFSDYLESFKRRCREWEEHHNGSSCVVERVRDTYLMPKVKEFWASVFAGEPNG